jgi:hypothetical protein
MACRGPDTMLVNAAVDSAGVEIQFIDAQFDGGQTWFLVYSEMNGNSCVARRYVQINPVIIRSICPYPKMERTVILAPAIFGPTLLPILVPLIM